jgi:hypothetical protein
MKYIAYIALFLLLPAIAMAQKPSGERIRTIKIGYMSERLHLSPEQATKFWPVYNKYQDELKAARRELKQKYKTANPGSNEQMAREFVADNFEYKQTELNIQKKYKDEMMKIITPQQLAVLYQAERDFKTILLKQLKENKNMRNEELKPAR